MMRKVSFVGTALLGLIASAALLSSCGQQTQTPNSPEATSPTPNAVAPVAGSSTPNPASPVVDASANTASPAAESTASNTTSPVATSPTPADATASTATPADSTTASSTTESPAATADSTTTSSTGETSTSEFISATVFEEIDANKAGKIASADFVNYYSEKVAAAEKISKEDAEKKFKQLDKDSDGSLTKQEATGQM